MQDTSKDWALILGGSKGLGMAAVKKLAGVGFPVAVAHRDPRKDLDAIHGEFEDLKAKGARVRHMNCDAIGREGRSRIQEALSGEWLGPGEKLGLVVYSIARGNLKPMSVEAGEAVLTGRDLEITAEAMAFAFYDWARELKELGLLSDNASLLALTSEGSRRILPAYGAVGAAKAALESLVRQMAVEWAGEGIRVNCIQAGVTDTDSVRRIPGSGELLEHAVRRNPSGRLTQPGDVADAIYLLSRPEAAWITGNIICADGGERLC
ncbi:SDR family oxidoreductase [Robiginitalea sp. SC105]|nr:SDR family oxidoreductase [Robiginitalea sp. SC105]